jgi:hypothetical protein
MQRRGRLSRARLDVSAADVSAALAIMAEIVVRSVGAATTGMMRCGSGLHRVEHVRRRARMRWLT